jgi:hypothetical protein
LVVWSIVGLLILATVATYARVDPKDLYRVSRGGIAGGLSRAVVELNFPVALVSILIVLIVIDGMPRRAWMIGGPAIALCAVSAWPGVVDQSDLDARPINALPVLGVVFVLGLTMACSPTRSVPAPPLRYDTVRAVATAIIAVLALPWIAAAVGFFLPDVVFLTGRSIVHADGSTDVAVHHGLHHGFDGALMAIFALALSRPRLRSSALKASVAAYAGLLFAYGAVNMTQDLWNEQLVKRGTTSWQIPDAKTPKLAPIWLLIVGLGTVVALALQREVRSHEPGDRGADSSLAVDSAG